MTMRMRLSVSLLLLLGLVSACATPSPSPGSPGATRPEARGSTPSEAAELPRRRTISPAAAELVQRAERESAQGRHEEAAILLERAVRIEPGHPVVWQNLAVVRYRQGDYSQAEQLALRSNALGRDYPDLRIINWELISVARERQGDAEGAREARERGARVRAATSRS